MRVLHPNELGEVSDGLPTESHNNTGHLNSEQCSNTRQQGIYDPADNPTLQGLSSRITHIRDGSLQGISAPGTGQQLRVGDHQGNEVSNMNSDNELDQHHLGRSQVNSEGRGSSGHTTQGSDNVNIPSDYLSLHDVDMNVVDGNNRVLKKIFDVVASTGQPNYTAARIRLPSALNLTNWRIDLKGYGDYRIVDYLAYGWPIGINRDAILHSQQGNHLSARAHSQDVEHYIATELGLRALLGPFEGPPAATCHLSPLMTRVKRDSKFRRVIVDLSWPHGASVNDAISRTTYIDGPMTISLPTTDEKEKGPSYIRRTCRGGLDSCESTPSTGRCYRHEDRCFMDICPPFGLRSSAMAMQRVSQAIVHLHAQRGFVSRAYIDDFGGAEPARDKAATAISSGPPKFCGILGPPRPGCSQKGW